MKRLLLTLIFAALCLAPASAQIGGLRLRLAAGVSDSTAPVVTITGPTSGSTYDAGSTTPLTTLAGTATDNVAISQVTWTNSLGGSGTATLSGTQPNMSWSVASIGLNSGTNVITVTATDSSSNTHQDTLSVTYSAGSGTHVQLITQHTFDEAGCVAWNAWDGNNFDGVNVGDAYYTDTKSYSLCGPGDGWIGYNRYYAAPYYNSELIVNSPTCPIPNTNCMQYRPGEGTTAVGGGLFLVRFWEFLGVQTPTIFISHVFKFSANYKFSNGSAFVEPHYIKWVDLNDCTGGACAGQQGARLILGFGSGGSCVGIAAPGSQDYNAGGSCNDGSSTPFSDLVEETAYCYAMYADLNNDIRRTWLGPYGGTIVQLQDTTNADLNFNNNMFRFVQFFTNQNYQETDDNVATVYNTQAAGRTATVRVDNVVIGRAQPATVDCSMATD